MDSVAQCVAQAALSSYKGLNVIGSGSSVDNEVSGYRIVGPGTQ